MSELLVLRNTRHGMSKTPEYHAYMGARDRCTNSNTRDWIDYGGRGIKFEFSSFEEFFKEVGLKPGPEYSLDRIDNDKGYSPGNVRWTTLETQNYNRRARKTLTSFTDEEIVRELEKRGIEICTIRESDAQTELENESANT